jgi:hypothetical protein
MASGEHDIDDVHPNVTKYPVSTSSEIGDGGGGIGKINFGDAEGLTVTGYVSYDSGALVVEIDSDFIDRMPGVRIIMNGEYLFDEAADLLDALARQGVDVTDRERALHIIRSRMS